MLVIKNVLKMSLLQNLSYQDYKHACSLSREQCEVIAILADLKISFNEATKPGELMMKYLDRRGYSVPQYKKFLTQALNTKTIITYYKPQAKVAILIANDKYKHLSKLATPSIDCDSLAANLSSLGFLTVIIKNTLSSVLKNILESIVSQIPEDSYCLIFYAGHGCEIYNIKCILSIDCPTENIEFDNGVTENWILREVAKCKPELCILIMDMCRVFLNRVTNKKIYESIPVEYYTVHSNLITAYSTQSSQAAYEVLQIECSTTIDNDVTYELKPGDTDRIVPGASQYVNALCTRLTDTTDISVMLDNVHADVENSLKKQRPIKVQCGVAKRSLYDPVKGDMESLQTRIREVLEVYKDKCTVF